MNSRPIVLAIDDDPDMHALFRVALRHAAIELRVAGSIGEAESCLSACAPNLILLDLNLQGTSGFDFSRQLSAVLRTPIVAVSASCDDKARTMALQSGCCSFITKPINLQTFATEITSHLSSTAQMHHELAVDPEFQKVRQQYFDTAIANIEELTSRSSNDFFSDSLLRNAAHRWAGASASVGLPEAEPLARRLENFARSPSPEKESEAREVLSNLKGRFQEARSSSL